MILARRVDTALREGNLERDQIKQDRIAELINDRFLGFGQDGELYDALLHCCDAIVKHADRAQAHILGRVQTELSKAHAQSEIGDRAGSLVGADFAF